MAILGSIIMAPGLLADRPAASIAGRLYPATDTSIVYRDTGSAWEQFAGLGDVVSPLTTEGDLLVAGSGGAGERLAVGTNGQALIVAGGVPAYGIPTINIGDIANVNLTPAPLDGEALVWDATATEWVAGSVASGGSAGGGATPANIARYSTSSGATIPTATEQRIDFATATYDPDSQVTTGASWRFTAPEAGFYRVEAVLSLLASTAIAAGNPIDVSAVVESADSATQSATILASLGGGASAGSLVTLGGSDTLYMAASEKLYITVYHEAGVGLDLIADGAFNHIAISQVKAMLRRGQGVLTVAGTLAAQGSPLRLYNQLGVDVTITKVFAAVNTAPTGAAIIVDVTQDGTSLFAADTGARPQIAAGANTGSTTTIPTATWADGSHLKIDVLQVGSTVAGADLSVHVVYNY